MTGEESRFARAQERIAYVDALRGIAVAAVVLQHVAERLWEAHPADPAVARGLHLLLLDTVNLGRFGVILFFLISGFVVPFGFRGGTPIRDFALSRLFRLYPAYWLSIFAAVITSRWTGMVYPPAQVLANVTMVQRLLGEANIRDGYWTLFFELVFYAGVTLLFWRGLLTRPAVLGSIALACVGIAVGPAMLRYGLHIGTHSPDDSIFLAYMVTGTCLRMAADGSRKAKRWSAVLMLALVAAAILLDGLVFPVTSNLNPFFAPVPLTAAYLLGLAVFGIAIWARWPRSRVLAALGRISYSVYLNHGVVVLMLVALLPPGRNWPREALFATAAILLSLLSSAFTYRLVERPAIALGRRITHRAVPRQVAEVAP